jgi:hypothetical protein
MAVEAEKSPGGRNGFHPPVPVSGQAMHQGEAAQSGVDHPLDDVVEQFLAGGR